MFKKGQLFVNKDRDLVVVDRVYSQSVVRVRNVYWDHHLTGTGVLNGYRLIGNNYQAKQKCSR